MTRLSPSHCEELATKLQSNFALMRRSNPGCGSYWRLPDRCPLLFQQQESGRCPTSEMGHVRTHACLFLSPHGPMWLVPRKGETSAPTRFRRPSRISFLRNSLLLRQFGRQGIVPSGPRHGVLTGRAGDKRMSEESHTARRLAAILAADVVGYSRLMGADEEGTLAALKGHRKELIDPLIAQHQGRIVKTTGDGLLIEFASIVDAVRFAVVMQQGMKDRNANLDDSHCIRFRVGINVGDVIVEDGDIFGDGVNVAARLETLAEPGEICVSATVREHVGEKLPIGFADLGEHSVKNIARPVHVYRIETRSEPKTASSGNAASSGNPGPAMLALPDRPSIAVLPFANMSGDAEQDYFCDGMVEDIITGLSRLKWMFVIARNSSFVYKGKSVDVKQVGRDLGVRYVLEGSVRKASNRVRVTGQVVEAETGRHVWAERYDRTLDDIFALQDDYDKCGRCHRAKSPPSGGRTCQAKAARQPRCLRSAAPRHPRRLSGHAGSRREGAAVA
ncbi:adenylate/guanylate cyclase domain-containing protein [Bradyrhizobium manausense]